MSAAAPVFTPRRDNNGGATDVSTVPAGLRELMDTPIVALVQRPTMGTAEGKGRGPFRFTAKVLGEALDSGPQEIRLLVRVLDLDTYYAIPISVVANCSNARTINDLLKQGPPVVLVHRDGDMSTRAVQTSETEPPHTPWTFLPEGWIVGTDVRG